MIAAMPAPLRHVFPGPSAAAAMLRALDWSATPVGPPSGWPGSLRAAISLGLTATLPTIVCWGEMPFANDAWSAGEAPLDPRKGVPPDIQAAIAPLLADTAWADEAPAAIENLGFAHAVFDDDDRLLAIVVVYDLAARLAHRLREPIAPLLMTLDLMKLKSPSAELDVIDRQVRHLAAVVGDIAGGAAVPKSPTAVAMTALEQRPRRILIVEDDDTTAHTLEAALTELGHIVALAHDAPVALVVAREFQPELVLLDIGLPVVDGWNLADRMRDLGIVFRFIAVTGRATESDVQRSMAAGFDEHLVKPVDVQQLLRSIHEERPPET